MDSCFNQIGSTILNGAFTSFMAGIFLYMCQYSYLHKFGILMMFTISTALVFSMTFYPALCYFKGPENHQGDLVYNFLAPMREKCTNWRRSRAMRNQVRRHIL